MITNLLLLLSIIAFIWSIKHTKNKDYHMEFLLIMVIYNIIMLIPLNMNITVSYISFLLLINIILTGSYVSNETIVRSNIRGSRSSDLIPILSIPLFLMIGSYVGSLRIIMYIVTGLIVLSSFTKSFEKYNKNIAHPILSSIISILILTSPVIAYNIYIENNYYSKTFEKVYVPFNITPNQPYEIRNYSNVLISRVYYNPLKEEYYVFYNNTWIKYNDSKIELLKLKLKHPYKRVTFEGYIIENNTLYKMCSIGENTIKIRKSTLN